MPGDSNAREESHPERIEGSRAHPDVCYGPPVTASRLHEALARLLPPEILHGDPESLQRHSHDETEDLSAPPELVVRPRSEDEVRAVLAASSRLRVPVTPQGART